MGVFGALSAYVGTKTGEAMITGTLLVTSWGFSAAAVLYPPSAPWAIPMATMTFECAEASAALMVNPVDPIAISVTETVAVATGPV